MQKKDTINVFEIKPVKKVFANKITCADVFNQFLYVGDQKGKIYSFPVSVRMSEEVIAKETNEQVKSITTSKIDKLLCYAAISSLVVLSDERIFIIDTAFKKVESFGNKIIDFAINQFSGKEGKISSIVALKKKEGNIFYLNPQTRKFEESKKFNLEQVPTNVGFTGSHIILSYKKDYEVLIVQKNFALTKASFQAKSPFFKVMSSQEILFFMDDIGLFMDPQFTPRQKDNVFMKEKIINATLCGNYCLIQCETILQIYSTFDQKKFTFVQEIPLNASVRGITNERPFIYGQKEIYFLYEIPYENQIKILMDRGRVDDAINLLAQNVGSDSEGKMEQLKINAIWPLLKNMNFQKAKQLFKEVNFDIREIILLYPELLSLDIQSIKNFKAQKTMSTLIVQAIGAKSVKGKDDEAELKKKSKLFLKEVLQFKRDLYLSKPNTLKLTINFNKSKLSLIKPKQAKQQNKQNITPEILLEIIDFCLIRWFLDMNMFRHLEEFFQNNNKIYCKRLFGQFESLIKNNPKLVEFPTLKPRFYTAFERLEESYESWKVVAESNQKDSIVNTACEESVKILTQLEDRQDIYKKLLWILKKRPQIGMSFFREVDLNFIQPDEIIRSFEQQKSQRYLQLYLETIVFEKKTQIEAYHTKLLLLYIDNIFKLYPKENKEQPKSPECLEKLSKMRKLLRNPQAKYASEPILKKIEKCDWLLEDEIYLYSREKRHEEALRKYINKNLYGEAENYCKVNRDETLTIYFKLLLAIYKSYENSKNNSSLLLKKDIILFLKKYSSNAELDPLTVLELIPDNWMLNDSEGIGGIYQFLESAITHTLHEKRSTYTSKHLSEMDLLNVEYNLIQAKKAYLRFTYKKKCCICQTPISDKYFVVYPNANVCHQACVKKQKNTVCPVTKQDFEKTFKY